MAPSLAKVSIGAEARGKFSLCVSLLTLIESLERVIGIVDAIDDSVILEIVKEALSKEREKSIAIMNR